MTMTVYLDAEANYGVGKYGGEREIPKGEAPDIEDDD